MIHELRAQLGTWARQPHSTQGRALTRHVPYWHYLRGNTCASHFCQWLSQARPARFVRFLLRCHHAARPSTCSSVSSTLMAPLATHIGSPQSGPKVAAILSVVESCRRLKLPVRDHLAAVLPGLADLPIHCLLELTPAEWVVKHFIDSNDRVVGGRAVTRSSAISRRN
jgi:hypothetical protein